MARQPKLPDTDPKLPGTDHAKVKFVGLSWETLDVPELLQEITLVVTGTVVAHGEEVVKDGVRQVAKVKVTAVSPHTGGDL